MNQFWTTHSFYQKTDNMITLGDKLKCIFTQPLPGNDHAPKLKQDQEYVCIAVHIENRGFSHIDVGLPLELNFVRSFETGEELPGDVHWCHPNRFIKIQ